MSRLLTVIITFVLSAVSVWAQPDSLIVKVDSGKLPAPARLRLGKLAGYRYAGTFSSGTLSSDGKLLAVSPINGNSIDIIDLATGKKTQSLQTQFFGVGNSMAFSPDAD